MVKEGEIDFRMLVFLVVLHIIKQFRLDFICNRHNLEVFGQKIGDLMPFRLRKVTEFRGEQAFVIETLRHRDAMFYGFAQFRTIAFYGMANGMPEVQNMPIFLVCRVFSNHILLEFDAKINVFLLTLGVSFCLR